MSLAQWSDYVHDYCFVTKTYLAPPLDEHGHVTAPNVEINYYQVSRVHSV